MSKKVTCSFCGSEELYLISNEVRFGNKADVYICQACSLTFLDQDSFHFPEDFYEKEYHQTYITHVEPDALNPQVYYEKMRKSTRIWADKFRDMLTGNEVVLDIGCSTGHFIDMVKDKTKAIYGHELNKKEVEFCKSNGLDVSSQPLNERFEQGSFDYISMIYVLEHIAQPKEYLMMAKKFLRPDGKFVILVPNIHDALVSFYDIPEFRSFYYCIEHLFYYSQQTINQLFDAVGLVGNTEIIQEYPITNHLNWAYCRKPSDTLDSRKGVPHVTLANSVPEVAWEKLWSSFNQIYRQFLKDNGFGDRVWATASMQK